MKWSQFKDPICYLCPAGTVVVSWSLTQEVAGLRNLFLNIFLCHWIQSIQRKYLGKTQMIRLVNEP